MNNNDDDDDDNKKLTEVPRANIKTIQISSTFLSFDKDYRLCVSNICTFFVVSACCMVGSGGGSKPAKGNIKNDRRRLLC
jgi:hypothetical protein